MTPPASVVHRILRHCDPESRRAINELMKYPEDSAGSIMTTEFVSLTADMTVEDASVPPPVVDVVDLGANTFLFSWPAAATGFTLESATNLPSAVWNPVATPPDLIGDVFQLQKESAGPREYFRLRK